MTPLDLARSLATSEDRRAVVLGVAMVTRALTAPDSRDPYGRQGWPLTADTVRRAAAFIGATLTPAEVTEVIDATPLTEVAEVIDDAASYGPGGAS